MIINFNYLQNKVVFFKQRFLPALTAQQQKILLVAAAAFALLIAAICFAYSCYNSRFKPIPSSENSKNSNSPAHKKNDPATEQPGIKDAAVEEATLKLDFGYVQREEGAHFYVVLDTETCIEDKVKKLFQALGAAEMNLEVLDISADNEYKNAFNMNEGCAILVKQHDAQDEDHSKGFHSGNTVFDTFKKVEKAAENVFGGRFSISDQALKHIAEFEHKVTFEGAVPIDQIDPSYVDMIELKKYLAMPRKKAIQF